MKKLILIISSIFLFSTSYSQLVITESISNLTTDINDGKISVEVSGGEEPYEFYWSNKSTSLDSYFSEKLTEGVKYSVKITDANGLCDSLSFIIESESVQEKINNAFIPVVTFLEKVIFWDPFHAIGIYDNIIKNKKMTENIRITGSILFAAFCHLDNINMPIITGMTVITNS